MHRFFVAPGRIDGDDIAFPTDLSRQMARVLRMKAGDSVIALDDSGLEYLVKLSRVDRSLAEGRIVERREGVAEPQLSLSIYQAMVKADRFETLLQKCVELGVRRVIPVITRRTEARNSELSERRGLRWRRIIREAAEQCGRSRLAELGSPMLLADALERAPRPGFIAWEGERRGTLARASVGDTVSLSVGAQGERPVSPDGGVRTSLSVGTEGERPVSPESGPEWERVSLGVAMERVAGVVEAGGELSVFVGPEGGFEASEVEAAVEAGLSPVGLGRRILRAETAAISVAAIVMHRFGEMGAD